MITEITTPIVTTKSFTFVAIITEPATSNLCGYCGAMKRHGGACGGCGN